MSKNWVCYSREERLLQSATPDLISPKPGIDIAKACRDCPTEKSQDTAAARNVDNPSSVMWTIAWRQFLDAPCLDDATNIGTALTGMNKTSNGTFQNLVPKIKTII